MAAPDTIAFLRATPPFCDLPKPLFEAAAQVVEDKAFSAGTRLVERDGSPLRHLYVIRRGAIRLERDGQVLQILEEGEIFGYTSLITKRATMDAVVEEDLLAYRLPATEFERLLSDAQFAGHFASGLGDRLRHSLERSPVASFQTDLAIPVETRARRDPVRVAATATVSDAARAMRDANVGSVLVDTDPPGIVTLRDFRDKVLAEGLGPDTPVLRVTSAPLRTVPAGMALYEAWQALLDAGVHHLPIERGGEIIGVLSSSDLLRSTAGPIRVLRSVERLASRDALAGYADKVTQMVSSLLAGGLEPTVIAGFVARLNDALLRRILQWAEADLGPVPAPYAWIVFGSEGRQEQTLLTDQDNALVHGGGEAPRQYFARLADRANEDLEAAGFPRCPGGYMARNWHGPLEEWEARFSGWIDDPKPNALLLAAIFFDFRKVHGALDLNSLEAVLARAARQRVFLACMAKAALQFGPPPSLFLRLRGDGVDLKLHGISRIVLLARPYALEAGSSTRNTIRRLEAAVAGGLISADRCATLSETYRFLLGLRIRQQLQRIREGEKPVSELLLSELTSIERSRLKDAFRAISDWQEKAAYHYRTEMF